MNPFRATPTRLQPKAQQTKRVSVRPTVVSAILLALALVEVAFLSQGAEADGPLTPRAYVPLIAADGFPPPPTPAATAPTVPTTAPTAAPTPTTEPTQSGVRIGAICRDGTSSTATGSGACSSHGGVDHWLYR